MKRARSEFNEVSQDNGKVSKSLYEKVNFEVCSDLTYLGNVIMEALRLYPVVTFTSLLWFENGAQLGPLYLQPKESFVVNIFGLHRNGDYWQRPTEFLPDRFDPSHPLSKTPQG